MEWSDAELIALVRQRPGMYVGTGASGLVNIVLEVVSNSFDLVLGRRAGRIDVTLGADGSIVVSDDGPGMDIGDGTLLESYFTSIRDEPTADGHWPHVHLGPGSGLGPVSATCERVDVEIRRGGQIVRQSFSRGVKATEMTRTTADDGRTGTKIRLVPDPEIFGDACVDPEALAVVLRELAFLEFGLVTSLAAPEQELQVFGPVTGLTDLFAHTFGADEFASEPDPPMLLSMEGDDFAVDMALAWSTHRWEANVRSYGNYRCTHADGSHVDGIEKGLRKVFGQGPTRDPLPGLMAGLRAVLHVRLMDVRFPGPTLRRLASPEATWRVADLLAQQLPAHLEQHPELAASLAARAMTRTDRNDD